MAIRRANDGSGMVVSDTTTTDGLSEKLGALVVSMAGSTGVNSATVQGTSASGATDDGSNPLKVGGVVQSTYLTGLSAGQRSQLWTGLGGALMVGVHNSGLAGDAQVTVGLLPVDNSATSSAPLGTVGFVYNGASLDRMRGDTSGQYVAGVISPSAASGVTRAVTSAAASALVIKASAGNLGRVGITTGANAGYLMLFNATTAPADGAVAPVSAYTVAANSTLEMDYSGAALQFATGMVAVFSTTGPFTKTASATAMIWADAK
jgi:hypothetical protein